MDLKLTKKSVLVTGASKGIGQAIAEAFAAEGARVALAARSAPDLERIAAAINDNGGEAIACPTDLTRPAEVQALVDKTIAAFGAIHVLVNNAGRVVDGFPKFEALSDEDWFKTFDVNLFSTVRLTRAVLPQMRRQKWGRIINIASELALQPDGDMPHYAASKAAILNLTKNISKEYALDGILINAVSPGMIATLAVEEIATETAQRLGISTAEVLSRFVTKRRPHLELRRPGRSEEVAAIVLFLASEAASYITGTNIRVDGGSVAGI
jgi:NAD(P)-dependent dehydrogenase (short-subunit alcohol dehydrogenase family)